MSKRVLSGSSSEDEQVGLLGGSGVNSRRARFEVTQIGDGSFVAKKKVSILTKFLTNNPDLTLFLSMDQE